MSLLARWRRPACLPMRDADPETLEAQPRRD